ncbi:PilZ domain-containing protein [Thermodesulfobacteriota bacterium]
MKPKEINPLDLINIKDILGCFYYVQTNNIQVNLYRVERHYNVSSYIKDIRCEDNTVALVTEEGVYFRTNEQIKISFVINSMRYSFDSVVSKFDREREVIINTPEVIYHDEQRNLPRINFPNSFSDCLELVTGVFNGVRIKGKVEDISLGGLSFTPDNIEGLKNKNEIDLSETNIKKGDKFRKLKFEIDDKTLSIPVEICHTPDDDRSSFGFKFDVDQRSKHINKLREFMDSCGPQGRVINFTSYYEELIKKKCPEEK